MCLLIVASRVIPGAPLVVAANRDERLDRPATPMTVLRARAPRIVGGRDEAAKGTWLAVNEHGVLSALTNRRSPSGRDPNKRSRGELPLMLTSNGDAGMAATRLTTRVRPDDYNPCWILVGDRNSLWYIDWTDRDGAHIAELGPGVHVLENQPLGESSAKVDHVKAALGDVGVLRGEANGGALEVGSLEDLLHRLKVLLGDHTIADPGLPEPSAAASACCVHSSDYATRSSEVVVVSSDPASPPHVEVADGPPCRAPFDDVTHLFAATEP